MGHHAACRSDCVPPVPIRTARSELVTQMRPIRTADGPGIRGRLWSMHHLHLDPSLWRRYIFQHSGVRESPHRIWENHGGERRVGVELALAVASAGALLCGILRLLRFRKYLLGRPSSMGSRLFQVEKAVLMMELPRRHATSLFGQPARTHS